MASWVRRLLELAFVAVGLVLVIAPTVVLAVGSFGNWDEGSGHSAWAILGWAGVQAILMNTLELAVIVTVATCAIAVLLVFLMQRSSRRMVVWILPVLLLPMLADQLARNYGWYFILRTDGILNQALLSTDLVKKPIQFLYTSRTVAMAMIQGLFPLAVAPLLLAVALLDPSVVTVARSLGATALRTLTRVVGPLLQPGLILGGCFVFATSFGYYITPKMLGGSEGMTIAALIDQRVNLLLDWPGASVLATLLALIAFVAMGVFFYAFGALEPVSGFTAVPAPSRRGTSPWLGGSLWVLVLALVVTPIAPIIVTSFTKTNYLTFPPSGFGLQWYSTAITSPQWLSAWRVSIIVATAAAFLATALSTGGVLLAARSRELRVVALIIVSLPLLLSPLAMAIGIYRALVAIGLTNEWPRLILGHTIRALPFPAFTLFLAARYLDPTLVKAVRVYGGERLVSWFRALGPHFLPSIAVGFIFGWLASFSDLEYSLFLGGPSTITLPIRVWSQLYYAVDPSVAAAATASTLLGAALIFVAFEVVRSAAGNALVRGAAT